jgi:SWI/SNF-related matrix-associated actin-dependent regulator of chromatin subfamily A member 5
MVELNSKYEGLNLDNLNNFKLEATIQQWDGTDFQSGVSSLFRPCCEAHMLNCSFHYSGEESFKLQLALAIETKATSRPRCTPALQKWIRHPKFLER